MLETILNASFSLSTMINQTLVCNLFKKQNDHLIFQSAYISIIDEDIDK